MGMVMSGRPERIVIMVVHLVGATVRMLTLVRKRLRLRVFGDDPIVRMVVGGWHLKFPSRCGRGRWDRWAAG